MAPERKRSSRRSNYRYNQARKKSAGARCKTCCRRFTAFMFSHVGLCALVVGYAMIGALVFQWLEEQKEADNANTVSKKRENTVQSLWEITADSNILHRHNWTILASKEILRFQKEVIQAVKEGYDGKEDSVTKQWSFSSAFLYSLTIITTIGYGNIAPRTGEGRVVTIVYAIVGIPLMLLYLTNIGDVLAKMFKYVYARLCRCAVQDSSALRQRRHHQGEAYRARHIVAHNSPNKANAVTGGDVGACKEKLRLPPEEEVRIEAIPDAGVLDEDEYENKSHVTVPITLCLLILVLYICGGGLLFSEWEGWTFLDGSYFCFVTLTTIGFGDLVPGDSISAEEGDSQGKLVLCSLYVLVGMALIAMCFNLMQEEVIHKVRSCGARIGILKDRDDEDD